MSKVNIWDKVTKKLFSAIEADDIDGIKEVVSSLNSRTLVDNLLHSCTKLNPHLLGFNIFTPLQYAVWWENICTVKYLIEEHHVDVDQQGDGYTENVYPDMGCQNALFHAINKINGPESKAYEIARLLLEVYDADVNLVPKHGVAPLFLACSNKVLKTVQLLINNGAKLDICQLKDGRQTALPLLMIAVKHKFTELVRYLLEQGVSVNEQDDFGHTPLHVVTDKDITKILLDNGAKEIVPDKFGMIPLHRACIENREDDVKLMLKHCQENQTLTKPDEMFLMFLLGVGKLFQCDANWKSCLSNTVDEYSKCKEAEDFKNVCDLERFEEIINKAKEVIAAADERKYEDAGKCAAVITRAIILMQEMIGESYPDLPKHLAYQATLCWRDEELQVILMQMSDCLQMLSKPSSLRSVACSAIRLACEQVIIKQLTQFNHFSSTGMIEHMASVFLDQLIWDEYLHLMYIDHNDREVLHLLVRELFFLVHHLQGNDPIWLKLEDIMVTTQTVLNKHLSERQYDAHFIFKFFQVIPWENIIPEAREFWLKCVTKIVGMLPDLSLNFRDEFGNTPLHLFVQFYTLPVEYSENVGKELLELIKMFLKRGARVDIRNHDGFTPYECIYTSYEDMELMQIINPRRKISMLQHLCVDIIKQYQLQFIYTRSLSQNIKAFIAKN